MAENNSEPNESSSSVQTKIAFTGHRDVDISNYSELRQQLKDALEGIVNKELEVDGTKKTFTVFLGDAIGADSIALEVCQDLDIPTKIIKSKSTKPKDYVRVAETILKDSDHLVTMWDGTFNGKKGGTSDVVSRFSKRKPDKNLHTISVKRLNKYKESKTNWPNGLKWALVILVTLALVDYLHLFGVSWEFDKWSTIVKKINQTFWSILIAAGIPTVVFLIVWYIYKKTKNIKSLFLEFLVPLAIAFYTVIIGSIGFCQMGMDIGNAIFSAANLLTLNSSIFNFEKGGEIQEINLLLVNARLAGGFFLAYAFLLAFSFATGRENISRLRFWWNRNILKRPFYVVIGNARRALFLTLDFEELGKKVVFLHQGQKENVENAIEKRGIYYMNGNVTSRSGLAKTYFERAEKVYILNDSDDENFRVCQEMIELMSENKLEKGNWFILLKNLRKRTLLSQLMEALPSVKFQTTDIDQNLARKIVLINDTEALADSSIKTHQNIIFGFNDLAEAIIMQSLRIGHFTTGRRLHIQVFYEEHEAARVKAFQAMHPELFQKEDDEDEWASLKHYTFLSSGSILDFQLLPQAESELIRPDFHLYQLLKTTSAVNLYVCLTNGLDAASLLATLLPRLNNEGLKYIKAYYYYNYLDKYEEQMIQKKLSDITKCAIPVRCFGNDLTTCRFNVIEDTKRDLLAKYIAFLYDEIYNKKEKHIKNSEGLSDVDKDLLTFQFIKEEIGTWSKENIENCWNNTAEIDKESNRLAADQAIVKFALMEKSMKDIDSASNYLIPNEDIDDLAEVEHRRWNAEKLLIGWLPTPGNTTNNDWKKNKKSFRSQKFHFHLTSYEKLPDNEKGKDYTQIMGLPYFMKAINSELRNQ